MFRLTQSVCIDVQTVEEPTDLIVDRFPSLNDDTGGAARAHCAARSMRLCTLAELQMVAHCDRFRFEGNPVQRQAAGCVFDGPNGPPEDVMSAVPAFCEFLEPGGGTANDGIAVYHVALGRLDPNNPLRLRYTTNPDLFDDLCDDFRYVRCCTDI